MAGRACSSAVFAREISGSLRSTEHGVDNDTWLMRNRDAIRQIKNRKVVIRDDRVVTAYPSRRADQKLALRRGRGKGLVK